MGHFVLATVHDATLLYRAVDEIAVDDSEDWSPDEKKAVSYGNVECARAVAQHVANLEDRSIWILNESGYYEMVEPASQPNALAGIALSMS